MGKKLKVERSIKKAKWNLFKIDSATLDNDLINGPQIELFHNNQAVIEGCMGVYEYNDTYLKLRLSKGAVILTGENFDILTFEDKTITVKGKINSLEFCL